jgi:hypothetical protein
MPDTVVLPARFNGPPSTGHGGYTCGVVAQLVGAREVGVSLRQPPPLERELAVVRDGDRVELRDGDTLVAEGAPDELGLELPEPVAPDEAAAASQAGRERWAEDHPFPTCVVCGPRRAAGDGLRLFPGALGDGLYAAHWTPDESVVDGDGRVRAECVWAALDCPTSAPVAEAGWRSPVVLARLTSRLGCPVRVGESYAIVSWAIGSDDRKHDSAAAMFDAHGTLVCASRALWIELRG